jgi:hypothetical protein
MSVCTQARTGYRLDEALGFGASGSVFRVAKPDDSTAVLKVRCRTPPRLGGFSHRLRAKCGARPEL